MSITMVISSSLIKSKLFVYHCSKDWYCVRNNKRIMSIIQVDILFGLNPNNALDSCPKLVDSSALIPSWLISFVEFFYQIFFNVYPYSFISISIYDKSISSLCEVTNFFELSGTKVSNPKLGVSPIQSNFTKFVYKIK